MFEAFEKMNQGKIVKDTTGMYFRKEDNHLQYSQGRDVWYTADTYEFRFIEKGWKQATKKEIEDMKQAGITVRVFSSTHQLLGYVYRNEKNELFAYDRNEIEQHCTVTKDDDKKGYMYQETILKNASDYQHISSYIQEHKTSWQDKMRMWD